MSKAEGKKIAIKFDSPINELGITASKYKYFKWLIEDGWGGRIYIYEIELKANNNYYTPTGIITASSELQPVVRAFDGDISSLYWRPSTNINEWVKIEITEPITIEGFRWHTGMLAYKPKNFKLMASMDGINWVELISGISPNTNGWLEFTCQNSGSQSGNEDAFIISGQEYKWLDGSTHNGVLINKTYPVLLVQTHPTELNSILLDIASFRNVHGDITVSYNQSLGNLAGTGGTVESFTKIFTPADLVEGLTNTSGAVGIHDYIEATVGGSIQLTNISKLSIYSTEYIEIGVDGIIQLIDINDINP